MARKRKRRKRRIRWKVILGLLGAVTLLVLIGYLVVILFETKKINVTGTQYSSEQAVKEWVQSDRYSSNTLYILWKYNKKDTEQLPAIERTKVEMDSPWEVTVQVTEKIFSGRMDYEGGFLYFDESGVASLQSTEVIEGVPYIEGMALTSDKIQFGKVLPAVDQDVFDKICSVNALMQKYKLTPEKINCENGSLTLHFAGVRVQIGMGEYEEKMAQAVPVLKKLEELYPGKTGVLHLENSVSSDSSIRFVPDAEEPAE